MVVVRSLPTVHNKFQDLLLHVLLRLENLYIACRKAYVFEWRKYATEFFVLQRYPY